jgi:hypothetical protein
MLLGWPLVRMSWSQTSISFFLNEFFGYKLKGNGVSLGDLMCLNVAIL